METISPGYPEGDDRSPEKKEEIFTITNATIRRSDNKGLVLWEVSDEQYRQSQGQAGEKIAIGEVTARNEAGEEVRLTQEAVDMICELYNPDNQEFPGADYQGPTIEITSAIKPSGRRSTYGTGFFPEIQARSHSFGEPKQNFITAIALPGKSWVDVHYSEPELPNPANPVPGIAPEKREN